MQFPAQRTIESRDSISREENRKSDLHWFGHVLWIDCDRTLGVAYKNKVEVNREGELDRGGSEEEG